MNLPDDATGNALREYVANGSNLDKPMNIEFFLSIPSVGIGDIVSNDKRLSDFEMSIEHDQESNEWTCYCEITVIPTYANITKIEALLGRVAEEYGAHYDGFGSFGNA